MKYLTFILMTAGLAVAAGNKVDIYTPQQLQTMSQTLAQKAPGFASRNLENYGNHHTMLAYREQTGSSELHEHEADIFVVVKGNATLLTGGKVVSPHTEKPGEIRGNSIQGGERQTIKTGDIVHIPAGVPHQLLIAKGSPFAYFVIKVSGQ